MSFLLDLNEIVAENEPLARQTYFGVGGPARWMVRPRSLDELAEVLRRCRQESVPVYLLGLGSNLLVSDEGVDGVVIRLQGPAFKHVNWTAGGGLVTVGGGVNMARLTLDAVGRGLGGLECMAGIPGTIGGVIRMNAGGRHGQISDVLRELTVLARDGSVRKLTRDEVGFGYRRTQLDGQAVVGATLALHPDDGEQVRKRHAEIWEQKRKSQPLNAASAGCVFKNPPDGSAGRLIEQAGLKGHAVGGAHVSTLHANFILAREGTRSRDVLALIGHIRRVVADKFGVELELEIQVWERSRTEISAGTEFH